MRALHGAVRAGVHHHLARREHRTQDIHSSRAARSYVEAPYVASERCGVCFGCSNHANNA
jgi:hypothetical protein